MRSSRPSERLCGGCEGRPEGECADGLSAPTIAAGEAGCDPTSARRTRMDSPTAAFAQVSDTKHRAFSRRR